MLRISLVFAQSKVANSGNTENGTGHMANMAEASRKRDLRPTSVAFAQDQLQHLYVIKDRERTTVGQIVRVAVDQYIARYTAEHGDSGESAAA